ncbi:MAG: protein-L-isoaspartate(D-aspartate) O-methyltransferase [Verrucomicrobiota bacterium]
MVWAVFVMAAASMIPFISRAGEGGELAEDAGWICRRQAMVAQLKVYHITNTCVLAAMGRIRRHVFIPTAHRDVNHAYADAPCPIGYGQTISQPFIVAYMTEKLALKPGNKVLEIGAGSGYQAAVLAECGADVYTIEIVPELARHARVALDAEGYRHVHILTGDGYKGWPEYSPFDAIIVTCAPDEMPKALVDQLKEGGRLIAPVGRGSQRLIILRKQHGQVKQEEDLPVRFVPMVRD